MSGLVAKLPARRRVLGFVEGRFVLSDLAQWKASGLQGGRCGVLFNGGSRRLGLCRSGPSCGMKASRPKAGVRFGVE